jgi:hypothetical protein
MTSDSASFAANGYAVLRSFLDAAEVDVLEAAVESELSFPGHSGMSRPGNDLVPLRWNNPIVAPILRSTPRMQRLGDVLQPYHLKWLSAYVSSKAPHSPALWWHQDWWCWHHRISFRRVATQVAVLVYLTPTSTRNGALRVLPGSHHASTPLHGRLPEPHGPEANGLPPDHPAMSDCPGQVTLALQAGDAVVLDYRLLHGTHPNESDERRDSILLSFIPSWRSLPREIKAHLIAHPALPDQTEAAFRASSGYNALLPRFRGPPASIAIRRVPPARFKVFDCSPSETSEVRFLHE